MYQQRLNYVTITVIIEKPLTFGRANCLVYICLNAKVHRPFNLKWPDSATLTLSNNV